jgi:hypothetical protein
VDHRVHRLRRKLAAIPFQPLRSHSFGEERHEFRLGPKLPEARVAAFEAGHGVALPDAYRRFLTQIGGSGAAPFYGLLPLERCSPMVMDPPGEPGAPRGFRRAGPGVARDGGGLFLPVVEMGCEDVCLVAVRGPLAGRVLIGNGSGYHGPDVSSAIDFPAWYGRWLDHMAAGRDDRALGLTSPRLHAPPQRHATESGIPRAVSACVPAHLRRNPN